MPLRLRPLDRHFARFCRTGDTAALGRVFDQTAAELLHVAGWLAGNRADADDLLQRTFLTAIEQRAQFTHQRRVLPWLLAILTNHARNLRRERARRIALPMRAEAVADPMQQAIDAEFEAWLAETRQAIGPPYADVLELHLEHGLNAREIADRLDRPAGTVRTQLVRALAMLRRRLPKGFAAAAMAWRLEPAVLATAKAHVLDAARMLGPMPAQAGWAAAGIVEGLLVMNKLWLVAPVLVLAFGIGVLQPWSTPPAPAPTGTPPSATATAAAAGSDASAAVPALQRVAVADAVPEPNGTRWLTVRRRDTGAAVAAADVWLAPQAPSTDNLPPLGQDIVLAPDLVARARQEQHATTDAHGRLALPAPSRDLLDAVAVAGDWLGIGEIDMANVTAVNGDVLWLDRDVTLRVRVTDAGGALGSGVPIALGSTIRRDDWTSRSQRAVARTGSDGAAVIEHAQLLVQRLDLASYVGAWVALAWPGFEGPGVAVDLRQPNRAPIELVLPPTGRIVAVADPAIADGEAHVGLQLVDADGVRCEYGDRRLPADGRLVLDHVQLGRRFCIGLIAAGISSSQELAGPTSPGETVVVHLDLPEHLAWRGHAIDTSGPLANQRLRYELLSRELALADADGRLHDAGVTHGLVQTDAAGTFCVRIPRSLAGAPFGVLRLHADGDGPEAQIVMQPIPSALQHDLGAVSMHAPEVQLEGTVMFDDGSPCRTAQLRVEKPGNAELDYFARERALGLWHVDWDGEHFAVRGGDLGEQVVLRVRSPQAVVPRAPIVASVPGRACIVLQRAGALVATVRAEGFAPIHIDVSLRNHHGERCPDQSEWQACDRPDRIRRTFAGLAPGTYDLCYGLRTQPDAEVQVRGIVVRAGETTCDPRLQDLTVSASTCSVHLVDARTGAAPAGRCVVILQRPTDARWIGFDGMHGVVRCVVQGEAEGMCYAPDHEPTPVQLHGSEVTVPMPSSTTELTLHVVRPPEIPADVDLRLRLDPELTAAERARPETPGGGGSMAEFAGLLPRALDLPWDTPLALPMVRGRYRVSLSLQRQGSTARIEDVMPTLIDRQVPARIELTAPSTSWQRALSALEK